MWVEAGAINMSMSQRELPINSSVDVITAATTTTTTSAREATPFTANNILSAFWR